MTMSANNNDDLLHGDPKTVDLLKQRPLPNNALPNAGFWNVPKPEGSKPIEEPKGSWPFGPEPSTVPALADVTDAFIPDAPTSSGGLVLPTSVPLHPEEDKAIHLGRMIQGVPLPHQRANREAVKQQRGV
jgi:hypothetical protein